MKLNIFASGSSGNCLCLSSGSSHILIDAGISMRRTETALRTAGLELNDISGVLITHEHSDHISGLKMLIKHHELPVYAPHTIANRLRGMIPDIEACLHIISVGQPFGLGGFLVRAFHTPHDTDESVGYRVEGGGSFAMATDMGHVTEEVLEALTGADTVLIEANHDVAMLTDGSYPIYLKRRILSQRGHLSNDSCAKLAQYLCEHGTRQIILGHLSRENNRPELALSAVRSRLAGLPVELHCAPPTGGLSLAVKEAAVCSR